ncbi:uncharacterized protein LOC121422206 [Lytechinus variegatus]|uniref:uncharacterized protein LOC121422206 n=1 Tax=Lytechinus variegatus TaxID=7654 RepID=UPI001BB1EEB0|nr:uncharacterized protein LOC121422206 [Lytechinus variegatus]
MNVYMKTGLRCWALVTLLTMVTVPNLSSGSKCIPDPNSGRTINYTVPRLHHCPLKTQFDGTVVETVPKFIRRVFPVSGCEDLVVTGIQICRVPDCGVNSCGIGWCEETLDGYKCHCPTEYTGTNCEYSMDAMTQLPEIRENSSPEGSLDPQSTTTLNPDPSSSWTSGSTQSSDDPQMTTEATSTEGHVLHSVTTELDQQTSYSTNLDVSSNPSTVTSTSPQVTTTHHPIMSTTSENSPSPMSTPRTTSNMMTPMNRTTTTMTTGYSTTGAHEGEETNVGQTTAKPESSATTTEPGTTNSGTPSIIGVDECSGDILIFDLGSNSPIVLENALLSEWPEDIALDSDERRVYWLRTGFTDEICSATPDGNNEICWDVTGTCFEPEGIDIDLVQRKVYLSCEDSISSMNLDGTALLLNVTHTGSRDIEYMAVTDRAIFWATSKKIYKSTPERTSTLFSISSLSFQEVRGLSVDSVGNQVFFVLDIFNGNFDVMQMDLSGNDMVLNVTLSEGLAYVDDFMVFKGKIYYTSQGNIYQVNKGQITDHIGCPHVSEIYLGEY